jgi:hypothetical protein
MASKHVRRLRRSHLIAAAAATAVAAGSVAAVLLLSGGGRSIPKPASDIASNTRVCMVFKAGDPDTTRIWAGVQQAAAAAKKINAQQTAIPAYAAGSANDVLAYAAGLRQEHCAVTVAVGDFLHDSVQAGSAVAKPPAYVYVSRAPVRSASVFDLQPEQATTESVAAEVKALIAHLRAK